MLAWRRPPLSSEWLLWPIFRSGVVCWLENTWVEFCSLTLCIMSLWYQIEITGRFWGRGFSTQYFKVCLRHIRRRRNDVKTHSFIGTQRRTSRTFLPSQMRSERLGQSTTRQADRFPSPGFLRKVHMSFRYLARPRSRLVNAISSWLLPYHQLHVVFFSPWRKMLLQLRSGLLMKRLRKCAASQRARKHPRQESAILREWLNNSLQVLQL